MTNYLDVARERLSRCEYRSAAVNALVSIAESLHKIAERGQSQENYNIAVSLPPVPETVDALESNDVRLREYAWFDMGGDEWRYRTDRWRIRDCEWWTSVRPLRNYGPYRRGERIAGGGK